MRELGIALGRMHGQAGLGRRDTATGGWTRLESIYSIPWSEQNPRVLQTRVFIPNEVGVATQRVLGRLHGHMREHKLTRHVYHAGYENTQRRARESCE